MSKKRHFKRTKQLPAKHKFPWLWLAVGGALLLVIGGLGFVWASSSAGPAVAPEVIGAPKLVVDQTTIDEGDVKLNNTVRTTFRLKNAGDQPLYVMGEPQVELVEGC
jgi:hypothetical protein